MTDTKVESNESDIKSLLGKNLWVTILMSYFSILIIFSLWYLHEIWSPNDLDTSKSNVTSSASSIKTKENANIAESQPSLQEKIEHEKNW